MKCTSQFLRELQMVYVYIGAVGTYFDFGMGSVTTYHVKLISNCHVSTHAVIEKGRGGQGHSPLLIV